MEKLHTSMRSAPPQETLAHAKAWAAMAGIDAVRDITALDVLGVPVFVSERRRSATDPYTYGKGRLPIESEVGAYMEAIETHFAEPGAGRVQTKLGTLRDLPGTAGRDDPIRDFVPKLGHDAKLDQSLLLARAHEVDGGADVWLAAELVFQPAPDIGPSLFGASSNGLASGNSVLEASIHALYELIERDIWSIEFVRSASLRVLDDSLPCEIGAIAEEAARNGLQLVVRHVPNDYAVPFFAAYLFDPESPDSRFFNGGWGCHHDRRIALTRAVTEAAQSRLAFLHGGREPEDATPDGVRREIARVCRQTPAIRFQEIPEQPVATPLEAQWTAAVATLRRVIDRPIYRVVYTPADGPLHVVRLVVPLLEHFTRSTMRIGPRMQAELEFHADQIDDVA